MWDIETKSTIYFQPSKRASPIEVYKLQDKLSKTIAWVSNKTVAQERSLIASAPKLLKACKDLLNWGRDHISPVHNPEALVLLINAHAAIVKATGEEN